jgi:hypothetical protein
MARALLILAAVVLLALPASAGAAPPAFDADVTKLTAAQRRAMTPSVWRPGCPVALGALRRVEVHYVDFNGGIRRGAVVVHHDAAAAMVRVMRALYRARFPIRRMRPIEAYRGDDFASIEADNTSAFNCRRATGSGSWSEHAYGRAIDVNPIENPYVSGGRTSHRASVPYLDRSPSRRARRRSGSTCAGAGRACRSGRAPGSG